MDWLGGEEDRAVAASVGASDREHDRQPRIHQEKATRHAWDCHIAAGGKNEEKGKISTNPQVTSLGQLQSSERQQNLRRTEKTEIGREST